MIAEADLVVVSMLTDLMLPTKLFEYAAMAKPAVVTAQPTLREYFDHDSAMFYEPDDENDLVRCILELQAHPAQAKSLASNALSVYEKYRWRTMKHEYLNVYEELLA